MNSLDKQFEQWQPVFNNDKIRSILIRIPKNYPEDTLNKYLAKQLYV